MLKTADMMNMIDLPLIMRKIPRPTSPAPLPPCSHFWVKFEMGMASKVFAANFQFNEIV